MRIITAEQRSEAWFLARRGCITGSEIQKTTMAPTTKGYQGYLEQLVMDLEGIPNFDLDDDKPWFRHGVAYEADARGWYQFNQNVTVEEVGFCLSDDYPFMGMSPDGLVGDDGLVEIKCRNSMNTFKQHSEKVQKAIARQIQYQLLISERQWCDYLNYIHIPEEEDHLGNQVPAFEAGHIRRIYPDPEEQAYLVERALDFRRVVLQTLAERSKAA